MIPKDPVMLLSYINTQLRDFYTSLAELCSSMDLEEDEIVKKLDLIDYHYSPEQNRFL